MQKKSNHGGARPGAGRLPKSETGIRKGETVYLSPENLEYRQQLGAAFSDTVNRLLDREREKTSEYLK